MGMPTYPGSGGYPVIDGHCHLLPPHLREPSSAAWKDRWFAECHGVEGSRFASGQDVLAALDSAGLERAVVFGWPFADPGLLREGNDYVASQAASSGGRLLGFATVNPGKQGAIQELRRCEGMGLRGIGELNCDAQGFGLAWEGGLRATLHSCQEAGWPALLHASEPVGHPYAGKGLATPGRLWKLLQPMLADVPALRLCLAHLGGGLPLYAHMPEVRRLCRTIWFDTAAVPYLYDTQVLPTLVSLLGVDRLCFGSDFPLLAPSRYAAHLAAIKQSGEGQWLQQGTAGWLGER